MNEKKNVTPPPPHKFTLYIWQINVNKTLTPKPSFSQRDRYKNEVQNREHEILNIKLAMLLQINCWVIIITTAERAEKKKHNKYQI